MHEDWRAIRSDISTATRRTKHDHRVLGGDKIEMVAGYLLGLREGLEAALILGVTFGVLNRMRRSELAPSAWRGVAVAVLLSIAAAVILFSVGAKLEGRAEQLFEGVTMLLAAGILTWMILWMGVQGREGQIRLGRPG